MSSKPIYPAAPGAGPGTRESAPRRPKIQIDDNGLHIRFSHEKAGWISHS